MAHAVTSRRGAAFELHGAAFELRGAAFESRSAAFEVARDADPKRFFNMMYIMNSNM